MFHNMCRYLSVRTATVLWWSFFEQLSIKIAGCDAHVAYKFNESPFHHLGFIYCERAVLFDKCIRKKNKCVYVCSSVSLFQRINMMGKKVTSLSTHKTWTNECKWNECDFFSLIYVMNTRWHDRLCMMLWYIIIWFDMIELNVNAQKNVDMFFYFNVAPTNDEWYKQK